jgi:pyrroloquinoline quinone biosynthesis protein D
MTDPVLRSTDIVELNPHFLFRWEEPQQAYILLYPEGLIKLNASAGAILAAVVGGELAVGEIVERFIATYGDPDVAKDVTEFLEASHGNGWIRIKH